MKRSTKLCIVVGLLCVMCVVTACQDNVTTENDDLLGMSEQLESAEGETESLEIGRTEVTEAETNYERINEETESVEEQVIDYGTIAAGKIIDVSTITEGEFDTMFYSEEISDELFQRIYGKSYKEDCTIPTSDLRYLRMLYMDLEGNTHIGEMIVNVEIADDTLEIFRELYRNNYPIEKMVLVDEYDADDNLSMADNNTSCFNYRVVEGTTNLSNHAKGMAIDLNPRYNPYVHHINGEIVITPDNGVEYADRTVDNPYLIDESDLAYQMFASYGFSWGGHWNSKDYQHFEYKAK